MLWKKPKKFIYAFKTIIKYLIPSMILVKPKSGTKGFHHLAEEKNFLNKLRDATISKKEYVILLKRLYYFFSQGKIISDKYVGDTALQDAPPSQSLNVIRHFKARP
jgi:hypothetical protein